MKEWLIIVIPTALIQLFIPWLELQIGLYIVLGVFFAYFSNVKGLFLKSLVSAAITCILIYLLNTSSNAFIGEVLTKLGVSSAWGPIAFVSFNALTAAFCFQIGPSVHKLFVKPKK